MNTSIDVTSPFSGNQQTSRSLSHLSAGALNRYELEAVVGSGKYSTVFRARRLDSGQTLAVKKVQVFDMDSSMRADCIVEVKLLQALDHPNIIRYMDSFIEDNELIIELELAEDGDLSQLIQSQSQIGELFEEGKVWDLFVQVCAACQHMHERRMMHRDIKPSNVFVVKSGALKLGDLGLSRFFSSKTMHACSAVGTPYYMSPEAIRGMPYDWSSDVWSLGCLLYELATLQSPFYQDGLNFYQLGKNITNCEYEPLPETRSTEMQELVASMIQADPQARPSVDSVHQIALESLRKYG
ncbi:hypothetical protein CYMTET_19344 [Cymbomonas tetramitiformis]|uniref:non-specific serine/threonine protein kinase n=1 Tax=Cymbomonas tetramitiformis TaxID=36881 RepID=A0AAE0L5D9_9CHLO|nr:hypothetical protein CYMTET_19344 [Cymbomonas tetramitiformis]